MKSSALTRMVLVVLILSVLLSACDLKQPPQPQTPGISETPTLAEPSTQLTIVPPEMTPLPEPRIAEADLALSFGDFEKALSLYQTNLPNTTDGFRAVSLYGQGLAYYRMDDLEKANAAFLETYQSYPEQPAGKRAAFWLGQLAAGADRAEDAVSYYQSYIDSFPGVMDSLVYERIGDVYSAADGSEQALQAYANAYLAPGGSENTALAMKIARMYEALGQADNALAIYTEQYQRASNAYTKASLDLAMGNLELRRNNTEAGYAYFQDAVNNFPQTYDAYSALAALVDAEVPVDDLQRGIINFNIGQSDFAIQALERYLSGTPASADKALYYLALAQRAEGVKKSALASQERINWNLQGGTPEDKAAIQSWSTLMKEYPHSSYVQDAIEDIVYTQQAYMGQPQLAINTALNFVAQEPAAAFAPGLLWVAGRYYETQGDLAQAAETWLRIGMEYPASTEAFNGFFFAGILFFRLEQYEKAVDAFNRSLVFAATPYESAGAYLWLGKCADAQGNPEEAARLWQSSTSTDPEGYYGLRAIELSRGSEPMAGTGVIRQPVNVQSEQQAAASWLRSIYNLPVETNLDYSSELFSSPRVQKAMEYTKLGLFTEAGLLFDQVRAEYDQDALNSFRLIQTFLDHGFYKAAILAAKNIVRLTGFEGNLSSSSLPPYFAYVMYGLYYLPWVQDAADTYKLDPLLLLSLIRQESHFDANISSSAGAGGLMQLMPATARQIAMETGWPADYEDTDVYNAYINLNHGANYLARQIQLFDGDLYAALAAYNGGPGNALAWREEAGEDPDVFLGVIRFQESRMYLRMVSENYSHYALLYGQ